MQEKFKHVLAIETSCDDTSVAIVRQDGYVINVQSATKDLDHAPYGGIVPEIASRNHSLYLLPLIDQILKKSNFSLASPKESGQLQIDGLVVTSRPGLIGALIVGIATAKSLSQTMCLPLIGVNHLEGHLLAPFLKDAFYQPPENFNYPYLALAISGGHSTIYKISAFQKYTILGTTRDDAAGEAFDKFAKVIGLGFPGGMKVDQSSKNGDPKKYHFPRSMIHENNLEMSFSGLKAAAQRLVEKISAEELAENISNLCASYQEAIVDILMAKLKLAQSITGLNQVIITGGVSANTRLREVAIGWGHEKNIQIVIPPLRYCTDNAAMIGYAGILRLNQGQVSEISLGPSPQSLPGDFLSS